MGLFFSFLRSLVAARKKPTAATVDSATAPFALWFFCFPPPRAKGASLCGCRAARGGVRLALLRPVCYLTSYFFLFIFPALFQFLTLPRSFRGLCHVGLPLWALRPFFFSWRGSLEPRFLLFSAFLSFVISFVRSLLPELSRQAPAANEPAGAGACPLGPGRLTWAAGRLRCPGRPAWPPSPDPLRSCFLPAHSRC